MLPALVTSLLLTGLTIPVLRRARVLDLPNHRSSHVAAVPRGGGLAVMGGIAVAVAGTDLRPDAVALLAGACAAAAVGLLDDVRGLSARSRLGAQVVFASSLCVWLVRNAPESSAILGLLLLGGVVWLVGYVNAYNFMDGINGISALSGTVAGLWFAWLGSVHDVPSAAVIGLALAGSCLGFLPWNAVRPKVFLGDVGSYGIGLLIAGLAFLLYLRGATAVEVCAPLVLYLADTGWALARRAVRREPLLEAHREHAYQRLCDAGLSHLQVALAVAAAASACCAAAALLPAWAAGIAMVAVAIPYISAPSRLRLDSSASQSRLP